MCFKFPKNSTESGGVIGWGEILVSEKKWKVNVSISMP